MEDKIVVGCEKGCEQRETTVNGEEYIEPVPLDVTNPDRCKWFRPSYNSCKDCKYVVMDDKKNITKKLNVLREIDTDTYDVSIEILRKNHKSIRKQVYGKSKIRKMKEKPKVEVIE